ncbi:MAG: glycosyltransferase family 2 protein [Candidatus Bathyarchaeia archaeon]
MFTVDHHVEGQAAVSIIVVFPSFPNQYVTALIDSTSRLTVKYELILLVDSIDSEQNISQNLRAYLMGKPNLVKTRLVLMKKEDNRGLALGRNVGAVLAGSPILLFADDDTMILDDIAPLLELLHANKCQGIQPLLVKLDLETVDSAGDYIKKVDKNRYNPYCRSQGMCVSELHDLKAEEIPYLRGAFMLIRKDALLGVGGFDSTFIFNYDDVDFGFRMTCAGYKLLFVPQVKAVHKSSRTGSAMTDRLLRLSVLNTHAMYLKIAPYFLWPYIILAYFERSVFRYEYSKAKKGKTAFKSLIADFFTMNKLFIARIEQAHVHREILRKHGVVGRQKLDDMASGKRFLYKE